jgi:hypothetical protein
VLTLQSLRRLQKCTNKDGRPRTTDLP